MGLDGIRTFEIHDELLDCAAVVRADPGLRAVVPGDPREVAAAGLAGELGAFGTALRGLLDRHGHRFVGRDLSYPTWRERPAVVVEMVQKLLEAGTRESTAERRARHRAILRRTADRIAAGVGGATRRLVFERAFAWCEEYYVLRENMRYHADRFLAVLRTLALSAAPHLVAAGELRERSDVFYLEADELRDALRGRCQDAAALAVRAAAATRRLRRISHAGSSRELRRR